MRLGRAKRKDYTESWDHVMKKGLLGRFSICRQRFLSHFLFKAPNAEDYRFTPQLAEFILGCDCEDAQLIFVEQLRVIIAL